MDSLSFDPLVHLYDETRNVDAQRFAEALDYLVQRYPPAVYLRVVEPGIGTGRIAIPLAERGYQVSGIDLSSEMLRILTQRVLAHKPAMTVQAQCGDATALPYDDASFDLGIAVHLFYFIPNWQQAFDEFLRVVKADGTIILMHTGYGMEVPWLMERYKQISTSHGYNAEHIGARSTRDVLAYATSRGCRIDEIRGRWQWNNQITLAQALSYLQAKAYSCTTMVPDELHREIMRKLTSDAGEYYASLDEVVLVPNEISLVIILRDQVTGADMPVIT